MIHYCLYKYLVGTAPGFSESEKRMIRFDFGDRTDEYPGFITDLFHARVQYNRKAGPKKHWAAKAKILQVREDTDSGIRSFCRIVLMGLLKIHCVYDSYLEINDLLTILIKKEKIDGSSASWILKDFADRGNINASALFVKAKDRGSVMIPGAGFSTCTIDGLEIVELESQGRKRLSCKLNKFLKLVSKCCSGKITYEEPISMGSLVAALRSYWGATVLCKLIMLQEDIVNCLGRLGVEETRNNLVAFGYVCKGISMICINECDLGISLMCCSMQICGHKDLPGAGNFRDRLIDVKHKLAAIQLISMRQKICDNSKNTFYKLYNDSHPTLNDVPESLHESRIERHSVQTDLKTNKGCVYKKETVVTEKTPNKAPAGKDKSNAPNHLFGKFEKIKQSEENKPFLVPDLELVPLCRPIRCLTC